MADTLLKGISAPIRRAETGAKGASLLKGGMAVRLIEAAYVILLGILITQLVYTLITPLQRPNDQVANVDARPPADVTIFNRYDPFVGNTPVVTDVIQEAVEETTLNLRLVGTFVSGDNSSATIRTDNGAQRPYYIGETVIAGVTIRDVLPDQVILNRNGVSETLSLEGREGLRQAREQNQASQSEAVANTLSNAPLFSSLSAFVTVRPMRNGNVALYPGSQPQFFVQAGLEPGDELVSINGQSLATLAGSVDGLAPLGQGGTIRLSILRNGQPMDISLNGAGGR